MYDELLRCLRGHSQKMGCTDNCICEDTYKRGFATCSEELAKLAADAIEELSMKLHGDEAAIAGMKREIERMVVASKPRWIPVTERLPDKDCKYLTVNLPCNIEPIIQVCCYAKDLYKVDKYDFCDKKQKHGFYQYDGEWGFFEVSGITHWMPLPEPPKEETDD